ncbi:MULTISPECIES: hypothetical protein [Streptomyces]|uniref:hypothetical protein n=1 Tax=Streptomyces TaxID=1883 RepID=UPI001EE66591|nr:MULTISPECIES: hypothetical protein [Streptomyces]
MIPAEEFKAGYDRLLAPLAEAGTKLILIEPFLLPIHGVVEVGAALNRKRAGSDPATGPSSPSPPMRVGGRGLDGGLRTA